MLINYTTIDFISNIFILVLIIDYRLYIRKYIIIVTIYIYIGVYMKKKQVILMSTLIPVGAAALATAIALPIVLNKKPVEPGPGPGPSPTPETDKEAITKINNLLSSSGQTFDTMSSVITYLQSKSYNLLTKVPQAQNTQYIWDKDKNIVFLMNDDGSVAVGPDDYTINENKSSLWKMVKPNTSLKLFVPTNADVHADSFNAASPYSQYLRKDESFAGELTFCSGIDTGENTDLLLKLVKDTAATETKDNITIATKGCGLIIQSASFKNINHSGSLLDLRIESLETGGSFNATSNSIIAGDVVITENVAGSFVAEPQSKVNAIFVASANVTINVNSTNVGTVSPTTETAAATIKTKVVIDQSISQQDKPEVKETKQDVPPITELSGLGTERSPYIVTGKADFAKIHDYYSKGYKYFKYASTTEMEIDGSDWETNSFYGNLYGSFDGSGLVIRNLSRPLFNVVGNLTSKADEVMKISNVTLYCDIALPGSTAGVARTLDRNAIFENVDLHGYISGSVHVGGYVCYGPGNLDDGVPAEHMTANWQFKNCHSDAMISATGVDYAAAFVAHRYSEDDSIYTFEDSIFTGVINTNVAVPAEGVTHQKYAYFVTGPDNDFVKIKTKYSGEFKTQYGNPEGVNYKMPQKTWDEAGYKCFYTGINESLPETSEQHDFYVRTGYIKTGMRNQITLVTQSISGQQVGTLQVEKQQDTELAYASLFVGPNGIKAEDKNLVTNFVNETPAEVTSGSTTYLKTNNVKNYNIYVNDPNHTTPGIQGNDYVIYDTNKYSQTTNPTKYALIIQYKQDNGGRYIPFYTTKFTW